MHYFTFLKMSTCNDSHTYCTPAAVNNNVVEHLLKLYFYNVESILSVDTFLKSSK